MNDGATTTRLKEELEPFAGLTHPKDLPILVAAIRAEARWLVTFNTKYFYNAPPGIQVIEPGQAIQAIWTALARATDVAMEVE